MPDPKVFLNDLLLLSSFSVIGKLLYYRQSRVCLEIQAENILYHTCLFQARGHQETRGEDERYLLGGRKVLPGIFPLIKNRFSKVPPNLSWGKTEFWV